MIDKLGIQRPLNFTDIEVKKESTPIASEPPLKVEVSHTFQEAKLGQSNLSELALFGSLQQKLIGGKFEQIRADPKSPAGNPHLQQLLQRLQDLRAQAWEIALKIKALESQLTGPNVSIQREIESLRFQLVEIEVEMNDIRNEIQKMDEEESRAEEGSQPIEQKNNNVIKSLWE